MEFHTQTDLQSEAIISVSVLCTVSSSARQKSRQKKRFELVIRDGSMFHPTIPKFKFEAWASQPIESVTGTSGTKVVDFSVDVTGLKREDEVAILDLDGCCVEMGSKNTVDGRNPAPPGMYKTL